VACPLVSVRRFLYAAARAFEKVAVLTKLLAMTPKPTHRLRAAARQDHAPDPAASTIRQARSICCTIRESIRVADVAGGVPGVSMVKEDELYQLYVAAAGRGSGTVMCQVGANCHTRKVVP
jgi:hypothetical protein